MSAEFTGESSLTINQVSSYLKYLEGKIETEPNVDGQSRKFATAIHAEYNGIDNPIFKGREYNRMAGTDGQAFSESHRDVWDFYQENLVEIAVATTEMVQRKYYTSWHILLSELKPKNEVHHYLNLNRYFDMYDESSFKQLGRLLVDNKKRDIQLSRAIIAELLSNIAMLVDKPHRTHPIKVGGFFSMRIRYNKNYSNKFNLSGFFLYTV